MIGSMQVRLAEPTLILRRFLGAVVLCLAGVLTAVHAQDSAGTDFSQRLYVTGGVGMSWIEPESPTDALTVSDDTDTGAHLGVGFDLSRLFTIEGYVADLGAADIDFLGSAVGSVDYQVYGASLLGYFVNSRSGFALGDENTDGLFRREGLSLYGRAGIGHMENSADRVDYYRDYATHAAFGLGLEYGFSNGFALRSELMSMDTDAQYWNLGLLKRFGEVPVAAPMQPVKPTAAMPVVDAEPEPVIPDGPLMFKPIVPPFCYFEFDKSDLNSEDRQKLDAFAEAMQGNDMDIIIEGHTDWIASESYNMSLSIRRAEAVYNYLASKEVAEERMTMVGYGETRPISNNDTPTGRALNRRAELKIR